MGFSQGTCTDSSDLIPNAQESATSSSSLVVASHYYCDHHHNKKLKFRTFLRKMIWEFGFACVGHHGHAQNSNDKEKKKKTSNSSGSSEHNKAWLLAESGGAELLATNNNADPQSVHSSFRFSFYSQVELESLNMSSSTAATVLMVNLDNGVSESRARELKWRRMESLEKTISPVSHSLIRFTFGEILSATRNFSKGNIFFPFLSGVLCYSLVLVQKPNF